jgi:hypothetical protein
MLNSLPLLGIAMLVLMAWIAESFGEDLMAAAVKYSFGGRSANPWLSALVYVILGEMIGFASVLTLPQRFIPAISPISGISLLLAPLAAGLLMHAYGSWRTRQAKDHSWLATFWGGALFAFSIALVRWTIVNRG